MDDIEDSYHDISLRRHRRCGVADIWTLCSGSRLLIGLALTAASGLLAVAGIFTGISSKTNQVTRPAVAVAGGAPTDLSVGAGPLPLTIGIGTCQVFTEVKIPPDMVDTMKQMGLGSHFFITIGQQMDWALRAGYRLVDTAQRYGNEDGVGIAVRKAIQAGVVRREDLLVCTKVDVNNMGYDNVLRTVDKSLIDLGVSTIDILLLHFPPPEHLRKETWQAMEKLHQQGKVRYLGVSNHDERHLKEIFSYATVRPVVNQIEVHPYHAQFALVDFCRKHGISVMGYCPLGGRGAAGEKSGVTDDLMVDPTIKSIASKLGMTPAQVMLRWALQRGVVPIPRAATKEKVEQNLAAARFAALSPEDMARINNLDKGKCVVCDLRQLPAKNVQLEDDDESEEPA